MIRQVARVAAWLGGGAIALAGLYWVFLSTPEDSPVMLAASAVLVALMAVTSGFATNVAVLLSLGEPLRSSLRSGIRLLHWFFFAAVPVVAIGWALGRADDWVAGHAGEISAWFIATFDRADVTALFTAQRYLSLWLRVVVVPAAALAALAALLRSSDIEAALGAGVSAWRWRTLLLLTVAFVVSSQVITNFAYVTGQVRRLPPTWVQPVVAAVSLAMAAGVLIGLAALMIVAAARSRAKQPV